jgi:hypothetical protein
MEKLILVLAVGFVIVLALKYLTSKKSKEDDSKGQIVYSYYRKDYFMSRAEHDFFNILIEVVGSNYIFPQVHLSAILNHKVKGQNWKAAFKHINGKSVDFVICDKANLKPLVAIELDDSSHNAEDRRVRDIEVERIFKDAALPLVRVANQESLNKETIKRRIAEALPSMQFN